MPSQPLTTAQRWLVPLPLLLALLSAWPALGGGFTNDDDILIVNNPLVHDPAQLWVNLTSDYFHSTSTSAIGYYRPLVKALFVGQYQLFGAAPRGYHLVSVLLFVAAVGLGLLLLLRLGTPPWLALGAAGFMATHPGQAESVAIVASQSDPLVTLLTLGAFYGHVRWIERRRHLWLALAALSFALALGAKETALVLPLLLAGWHLTRMERLSWAELRRQWPVLWSALPVLAYAALRWALQVLPISSEAGPGGLAALGGTAKAFSGLVLRSLAPLLWRPYLHSAAPGHGGGSAWLWLALALWLLLLTGLLLWRVRPLAPALLLLLLPLVPLLASSMVHVSDDPRLRVVSDRWVLLPSLGAGLVWAWLLWRLRLRSPRLSPLLALAFVALLAAQLLDARLENASFRDEATRQLWMGQALAERGDLTVAEQERVLAAQAIAADRRRDHARSVQIYRQLLQLRPEDHNRRFNLAVALAEAGQLKRALRQALAALHGVDPDSGRRLPRNDSYHRNRANRAYLVGWLLQRLGQSQQATTYYRRCLRLNPAHPRARRALRALSRGGKP